MTCMHLFMTFVFKKHSHYETQKWHHKNGFFEYSQKTSINIRNNQVGWSFLREHCFLILAPIFDNYTPWQTSWLILWIVDSRISMIILCLSLAQKRSKTTELKNIFMTLLILDVFDERKFEKAFCALRLQKKWIRQFFAKLLSVD